MKSYAHTKSWSRRGFCRRCLPADDNKVSSFTHNYCLSNMICTPVIWLLFFTYLSSAHRRRFNRFRGIRFLFFNLHTGKRRCLRGLPVFHTKIAPARALEYPPLSIVTTTCRLRPKLAFVHAHMCIMIHIFVCVCAYLFYPHRCAGVRAVWSSDGKLLLYINLSGVGEGNITGIIVII